MAGRLQLFVGHINPCPGDKGSHSQPQPQWTLRLLHTRPKLSDLQADRTRASSFIPGARSRRPIHGSRERVVWSTRREHPGHIFCPHHGHRLYTEDCVAEFPADSWTQVEDVVRSVRPRDNAMYVTAVLQRLEVFGFLPEGKVIELCRRGIVPNSPRAMSRLRWCGELEVREE